MFGCKISSKNIAKILFVMGKKFLYLHPLSGISFGGAFMWRLVFLGCRKVLEIFFKKVLAVKKSVIYLHPLSERRREQKRRKDVLGHIELTA